ncbi:uncharacterized protein LOC142985523 isoform X2 [Anticarsia gemmatalis]|uniref:uncharacterized protein LOC142985523 isoform X2 n=1 Tax=Anticarsia gemmatalis TaxID=129554 RepID=UPI003F767D15
MLVIYFIIIISSVNCRRRKDIVKNEPLQQLDSILETVQAKMEEGQNLLPLLEPAPGDKTSVHVQWFVETSRPKSIGKEQFVRNYTNVSSVFGQSFSRPSRTTRFGGGAARQSSILTDVPLPWLTTMPGEVLFLTQPQVTPHPDPFIEEMTQEMRRTNSGYITIGFGRLCEQAALKKPKHVGPVVRHSERIVNEMLARGRLRWLEEPMQSILVNIVRQLSVMPVDVMQSYAIMLTFMMQNRRDALSPEVNKVLEAADDFVPDDEGRRIFGAVKEFREYPNATRAGYDIASSIIEAFEEPYRGRGLKGERKRLVDTANKLFRDRFPKQMWFRSSLLDDEDESLEHSKSTTTETTKPAVTKTMTFKLSKYLKRRTMDVTPEYL